MRKILIINPFGIGDVLFSTAVIAAIKRKFPDSFIGFVCNQSSAPVLQGNPAVDELYFYTRGDLKRIRKKSGIKYVQTLFKTITTIVRKKFDFAVDLSMVNQYSMWLRFLGVKQIWGFDYKGRGKFLTHRIPVSSFEKKHVVEYYQDLLAFMGISEYEKKLHFYLSDEDKNWALNMLKELEIKKDDLLIGLAPFGGASWGNDARNKQWPIKRFAGVIKKTLANYNAKILLFGAEADVPASKRLRRMIARTECFNLAGKTSLGQLAALIAQCNLFLGNDSGSLHVACAFNVNTVSIFGPVDEKVYGPLGKSDFNKVISADAACRPCYKNFKKRYCSHMNCLMTIEEEDVFSAMEKMLSKKVE